MLRKETPATAAGNVFVQSASSSKEAKPEERNAVAAVVAIGCGQEGIEPLERFFSAVSPTTGLAYVICPHLSKLQCTNLMGTLDHCACLPVELIEATTVLRPDRIYIGSPTTTLVVSEGLTVTPGNSVSSSRRSPIDAFLESLVEAEERCAAVILPGVGIDGIRGRQQVVAAGGLALQLPTSPDSQNGSSSEALDGTRLEPEEMPGAISEHFNTEQTDEHALNPEDKRETLLVNMLLGMIEQSSSINFKQYRLATIKRRIRGRMITTGQSTLEAYVEHVSQNPDEIQELYRDFMIGVTSFFRDEEAFKLMAAQILPELFGRGPDHEIRIWVPGCATGEEAYTIAMLCDEHCRAHKLTGYDYKIFATDAHEASVQHGAVGIYDPERIDSLPLHRRQRYFRRHYQNYQIAPELRSNVVFATHNLLKDPPFTRIDLISCRNLLIYFNEAAQKKALSIILFATRLNGFLMLGPSESPSPYFRQFEPLDSKWRIFRKSGTAPFSPPLHQIPRSQDLRVAAAKLPGTTAAADTALQNFVGSIMEKQMPRSILVDGNGEVLHAFGDCDTFFAPLRGVVSLLVEDRLLPELQLPIHTARSRALSSNEKVVCKDISISVNGLHRKVCITVTPIEDTRDFRKTTLITFTLDEQTLPPDPKKERAAKNARKAMQDDGTQLGLLKDELQDVREQLRESQRQLEISNHEAQIAHEELLTSNEELQSSNEELRSVNEELFTVNAEYEASNRDLAELNEDVNNLLSSTDIGTVFVDSRLRIRKFTPKASDTLNLINQDIGRPIEHITHRFRSYERLVADIRTVVESGSLLEREEQNENGTWLLLRILPFRSGNQAVITGAVITLIDISILRSAQSQIQDHQRKLRLALEAANFGIWSLTAGNDSIERDARFNQILGLDQIHESEHEAHLKINHFTRADLAAIGEKRRNGGSNVIQHSQNVTLRSGEIRYISGRVAVYLDDRGFVERISGVIWDETETKSREQQILQKKNELETLLYVISHDLREPLRAIVNFSRLLQEQSSENLAEDSVNFLERIDAGARRMSQLLDDLLDLSRISQMEMPRSKLSGEEVVEAALASLEAKISETGAHIVVASDLPELYANLTYAKQAVYNLISNALKFVMPGEPPRIEISPYAGPSTRHSGLVIRDSGPGIPAHCVDRVFRLFQRAVGRNIEGTGAGLAIVRQIALKHGGDVTYEPRPDGGSKFTLTFLKPYHENSE